MRVSSDSAGLLAIIGAALILVGLAMYGWTRATGIGLVGYAAAAVTATAGVVCLVVGAMVAGWWR